MTEERRSWPVEVRLSGRTLSGLLVPYNREGVYAGGREVFLAGAFGPSPSIEAVNLQHVAGAVIATAPRLEVRADGVHLEAELVVEPIGDVAVALVKRRSARGLSCEFRCVRDERAGGLRRIVEAELVGGALVDRAAYPDAGVELRFAPAGDHRRDIWRTLA